VLTISGSWLDKDCLLYYLILNGFASAEEIV
jgi:hypothetical protein